MYEYDPMNGVHFAPVFDIPGTGDELLVMALDAEIYDELTMLDDWLIGRGFRVDTNTYAGNPDTFWHWRGARALAITQALLVDDYCLALLEGYTTLMEYKPGVFSFMNDVRLHGRVELDRSSRIPFHVFITDDGNTLGLWGYPHLVDLDAQEENP